MPEHYFLLNLDSTVTRAAILPRLAALIGMEQKMAEITERMMQGELPFEESFRLQTELLRPIPLEEAQKAVEETPINEALAEWLQAHNSRCFLATELLDVWIEPLLCRLQMQGRCFSSKATVKNGYIDTISYLLNKDEIIPHFPVPVIAVGNGDSDAGMLQQAKKSIAYGGARRIAPRAQENALYSVYDEAQLCCLLNELSGTMPRKTALDIFSPVF